MKSINSSSWSRTLLAVVGACIIGFTVGQVYAGQPNMRAALDSLIAAKSQLQAAEHDKAGHRVKAIEYVDSAIAEVKEGIRAGR